MSRVEERLYWSRTLLSGTIVALVPSLSSRRLASDRSSYTSAVSLRVRAYATLRLEFHSDVKLMTSGRKLIFIFFPRLNPPPPSGSVYPMIDESAHDESVDWGLTDPDLE